MRSARDNHNNTTQPAREIAGSLGCDAMQPPRRVSVDVSAAARFALLYFFLPLEASAHTYLQRLPACVLGGRSALICRRADPPGYQTPAQKKSPLITTVAARSCPGTATGRVFFAPWNNQRGRAVCLLRPCKSRGRCRTRTLPLPGASRMSTFSYGSHVCLRHLVFRNSTYLETIHLVFRTPFRSCGMESMK